MQVLDETIINIIENKLGYYKDDVCWIDNKEEILNELTEEDKAVIITKGITPDIIDSFIYVLEYRCVEYKEIIDNFVYKYKNYIMPSVEYEVELALQEYIQDKFTDYMSYDNLEEVFDELYNIKNVNRYEPVLRYVLEERIKELEQF